MQACGVVAEKVAAILAAPQAGSEGGRLLSAHLAALHRMAPFERYSMAGLPQPGRGIGTGTVLASTWPEGLLHDYLGARWFETDPTVLVMRRSPGLFSDTVLADATPDLIAARRLQTVKEGAGRHFVGVPIRHFGRPVGAVVIYRHEAFSPTESAVIELVAPALHAAAAGLPTASEPGPLTPRERECLAWCSEGFTSRQIGDRLLISEFTAIAHLNAAMRKLGAGSRTQAVAEAIRHGHIA
ncbi:helix-turn-helix transcriptional regulator [Blastochloris viridis]|uniref:Transcriptional activator protein luxR n=1 Tax=Blastochloris viridis TaxID=1079 RepID=A0A0H5BDV3_BLAVI|nr:helix-turn-helix domain-containing protein [Blastochloris viridis]ALK08214.1 Transcriptional activator protein LuxR [Blastochloris viridis]BAR98521.1 transcriptional regulator [Blastochloris viridis]CUU44136.1 Transcriptional activator protein luxR [Blastochloris viridis]